MVLADLGSKIAVAMRKMTQTTVIDQTVMNDMLTEICKALLQADVNIAQVRAGRSAHDRSGSRLSFWRAQVKHLREQVKKGVDIEQMAGGINKRKVLEQSVINELCSMIDPGKLPYVPRKKQANVIMFVGLQVRVPLLPAVLERVLRARPRCLACRAELAAPSSRTRAHRAAARRRRAPSTRT